MNTGRPLTAKQERYKNAFNGNHVEACRSAGYKNPAAAAKRNTQIPHLQDAIRRREEKRPETQKAIATREHRQKFWADMMQDQSEAAGNRLKASELLGRSNADFLDRVHQTGSQTVTIRIIASIPEPDALPEPDVIDLLPEDPNEGIETD